MTDLIIEFLKTANVIQLISTGIMMWFFYSRLDGKIEKIDSRLCDKIEKLDARLSDRIDKLDSKLSDRIDKLDSKLSDRIDKLSEKVEDIDRRLCRIEGSLSTHGHCLFNQTKPEKRAE